LMTGKSDVPEVAIIICGGEGTRLRPVTYEIPKPLMPVQGKPTVEHKIDELFFRGVGEVVLSVGYKADKIMEYFYKTNKKHRIDYAIEKKALGTGGALKFAFEKIRQKDVKDFLLVNGDDMTDIDIAEMYALHKKNAALATVALKRVADVTGYGVAVLDGDRIMKFVEKPPNETTPSHLINIGTWILNIGIIPKLPKQEVFSFERDYISSSCEKEMICGYVTESQFWPTDTMERYEKAIFGWKDHKARGKQ